MLHKGNAEDRQIEQGDFYDILRDLEGVAAHDLGGGAQIQNVLRHQRRAVQVAGVVVDKRDDREHRAGQPRGEAPSAAQCKEDQCQAECGQGVQRRVERPLQLQKAFGHSIGQFKLIAGDKAHRDSQQAGEYPLQDKFLPVYFFKMLHG